jgi:GAF domain-containing protein
MQATAVNLQNVETDYRYEQVDADRFKHIGSKLKDFQAASLLCVPLIHAGRTLGVVQVSSPSGVSAELLGAKCQGVPVH